MRKAFDRAALEETLKRIGAALSSPVLVFMLGGGAMCFRNQKVATKDLDLVFEEEIACRHFSGALKTLGFKRRRLLEKEYDEMKADGIWEDEGGFRFDLFVGKVCNALKLSGTMKNRSELLGHYGNLAVRMVSNGDVILFKGVTERPGDTDDIAAIIALAPPDWKAVLREATAQGGERRWHCILYNKFIELKERHGVDTPISDDIRRLCERDVLQGKFEHLLKSGWSRKMALAHLAKEYGFTKKELAAL